MITLNYILYREVSTKDTAYTQSEYVPMTMDFEGYAGLIAYIATLTGKTTGAYHIIDHAEGTEYYLTGIIRDAKEDPLSIVQLAYNERRR